jgi:hypothetical protein
MEEALCGLPILGSRSAQGANRVGAWSTGHFVFTITAEDLETLVEEAVFDLRATIA